MKLIIDTTQPNIATFIMKERDLSQSYEFARGHNDKTLTFLANFLKKYKIQPQDIKKIQAYSGPGSYTSVRVGATIAQALGFAWNKPVQISKKPTLPV